MKIIVKKSVLEVAVKNLLKVVNQKASLPILGDILIDVNAKGDSARLTASDSETWVTYIMLLDHATDTCAFCVNAKTLYDMIANVDEQPLTITYEENTKVLTIEHSKGSSYCMADDAETYPQPVIMGDMSAHTAKLDTATIVRTLRRSAWAVSKQELRPALCGINFAFMSDTLEVVATDGHVMMLSTEATEHVGNPLSFIMPSKVARMLPSMLVNGDVYVSYDGRTCCLVNGDAVVKFLCIDATYPTYQKIIPTVFAHDVTFNREALMNALQCVCPFTSTSSNLVKLSFGEGKLVIAGENIDFSMGAKVSIGIDGYEGEPMAIGMNAVSLITILSKLPLDDVQLKFNEPSTAMLVVPAGASDELGEEITALIMPTLIND